MKIQWSFSLFLLFDWKYPFWANLVQKIKIVSIAVIWYLDEFEHGEFNGDALFFWFRLEILFLGEFGPKNQNC